MAEVKIEKLNETRICGYCQKPNRAYFFECPTCGQHFCGRCPKIYLPVGDGKQVKCPGCGAVLDFPHSATGEPVSFSANARSIPV